MDSSIKRGFSYRCIQPYLIVGLAGFYYIYEFYLRVMPSAITHELMRSFSIEASGLGLLSSLFFFGYAPMQIPAGLLFDRFGPRVLLTISVFLCGAGALVFGMTDSFTVACIARWVIGFASSFAFVGSLLLASRWIDAKYYAMIAGLVQFMGSFGAIAGEWPIA
ncbi:MAG: MFS transporter, partial [Pseudomonadota bacterium]|nr:MFS transporter [Pseudomonadota bacterium]